MTYTITDEPKPTGLATYAVQPIWPLFAVMFAGSWLAWPWFVFNGFAVGSPTRWRELGAVIVGILGKAAIAAVTVLGNHYGLISKEALIWTLVIALDVWKIAITYWLYMTQDRTIELFTYMGGKLRNGIIGVFLGFFVGQRFMNNLLRVGLWAFVLAR